MRDTLRAARRSDRPPGAGPPRAETDPPTVKGQQSVAKHSADLELVERMLGGDEDAFTAFGERYFPACFRYTLKRLDGDRERTRDTVQTAMTKALTHLQTYRGEASLFTWLCACCRNETMMLFRSRSKQPQMVEIDAATAEEELSPAVGYRGPRPVGPEVDLLRAEEGHLVHLALDLLPERYARALEWKYLQRRPVREIAERLELSSKAAESLLTRARHAFRAAFREAQGAAPARAAQSLPGSRR